MNKPNGLVLEFSQKHQKVSLYRILETGYEKNLQDDL
jgi:hypothetical protein